eukprot:gene17315-biopygen8323
MAGTERSARLMHLPLMGETAKAGASQPARRGRTITFKETGVGRTRIGRGQCRSSPHMCPCRRPPRSR